MPLCIAAGNRAAGEAELANRRPDEACASRPTVLRLPLAAGVKSGASRALRPKVVKEIFITLFNGLDCTVVPELVIIEAVPILYALFMTIAFSLNAVTRFPTVSSRPLPSFLAVSKPSRA
jgi:hypothetical protein